MSGGLIDPSDTLERQNEKLLKIAETLMRRVEQDTNKSGEAYSQFQRAVLLEEEVRGRTRELERTLDLLNRSNAALTMANRETEAARADLANAIETVQEGFALFSPDDKLVMCNSRFGMHMPDIRASLRPGLSFADYVETASQSRSLALPKNETPKDWVKRRIQRHHDASVIFNVRMTENRWVQVSEHRTPDGGTVILQTDVTDIMRLEQRERERLVDDQARLIRATLEHLNQGVCIFDPAGRLVGWNRRLSELLAVPAGRFQIGAQFSSLFTQLRKRFDFLDSVTPAQVAQWTSFKNGRDPLSFEIEGHDKRIMTVFMQEMPDRGFVISFTDVTAERQAIRTVTEANETLERRVLERTLELQDALSEAERANASKSRFVAAASHDLLQPLSAAKLYVANAEHEPNGTAARALLGKATSALQSVESILEALLDISKLDSGRANVHVSHVDLGEILNQLNDELAPVAMEKGLDFRCISNSLMVRSDAIYLRRILQNLVSNAIRYTRKGRVLVGARRFRDHVRVEVIDTGPGIDERDQSRIFAEFQRLHPAGNVTDGLGLGLAIVERACGLLGHSLQLSSKVGSGTVFSVEIPRVAHTRARTGQPPATATVSTRSMVDQLILLIENDTDLRNALVVTIESWGATVLPCHSQDTAHMRIDEIGIVPDMIVADMQLDNQRFGSDAIASLRKRYGPIPACIISANRSLELDETAAAMGVKLLYKPFSPEDLQICLTSPTVKTSAGASPTNKGT